MQPLGDRLDQLRSTKECLPLTDSTPADVLLTLVNLPYETIQWLHEKICTAGFRTYWFQLSNGRVVQGLDLKICTLVADDSLLDGILRRNFLIAKDTKGEYREIRSLSELDACGRPLNLGERQELIYEFFNHHLIVDTDQIPGLNWPVERSTPVLAALAPYQPDLIALHDYHMLHRFRLSALAFLRPDIEGLREYFGTSVAMYFAYVVHINLWLLALIVVLGALRHFGFSPGTIGLASSVWLFLMSIHWSMKNKHLRKRWHLMTHLTQMVPATLFFSVPLSLIFLILHAGSIHMVAIITEHKRLSGWPDNIVLMISISVMTMCYSILVYSYRWILYLAFDSVFPVSDLPTNLSLFESSMLLFDGWTRLSYLFYTGLYLRQDFSFTLYSFLLTAYLKDLIWCCVIFLASGAGQVLIFNFIRRVSHGSLSYSISVQSVMGAVGQARLPLFPGTLRGTIRQWDLLFCVVSFPNVTNSLIVAWIANIVESFLVYHLLIFIHRRPIRCTSSPDPEGYTWRSHTWLLCILGMFLQEKLINPAPKQDRFIQLSLIGILMITAKKFFDIFF